MENVIKPDCYGQVSKRPQRDENGRFLKGHDRTRPIEYLRNYVIKLMQEGLQDHESIVNRIKGIIKDGDDPTFLKLLGMVNATIQANTTKAGEQTPLNINILNADESFTDKLNNAITRLSELKAKVKPDPDLNVISINPSESDSQSQTESGRGGGG